MGGIIGILGSLLSLIPQSIKSYAEYKSAEIAASKELKLAQITAEKEAIVSQNQADATSLTTRIEATTKEFKQRTFWLLCVPVCFSIIFPGKAAIMWHNFTLIPEYIQWLFLGVYSSIWGIPVARGGFGMITDLLQSRREYTVQKIRALDEAALAASLRKSIFKQGMTQAQWDAILTAVKDSEK